MATFNFYVDTKVTMWERANFEIEASTYNKALDIALNMAKEQDYPDMTDYETLYDTAEPLSLEKNDNQPTIELHFIDEVVWDNGKLND